MRRGERRRKEDEGIDGRGMKGNPYAGKKDGRGERKREGKENIDRKGKNLIGRRGRGEEKRICTY